MKKEEALKLTRILLVEDPITNERSTKELILYVHPANIEFIQESIEDKANTEVYIYSREVPFFVKELVDKIEEKLKAWRRATQDNNLFKNN